MNSLLSIPVKIGMMSFAHIHAESYAKCLKDSTNAEFLGIADVNTDRGRAMAEEYEVRNYESYSELLKSDVEAVVICSENSLHSELTSMAAEAGKHVLCEKPLATSVEQCQEMVNICRENGVGLYTAFPCRYVSSMARARHAIRSGALGEIVAVSATNRGKCPGGWFTDITLAGGGAVMDHTVHVVDLLRWSLESEVTEVYAEISNGLHHERFDDCGLISMRFANGVYATLDSSWSRPESFPTWGDVTMTVVGSEGSIRLDLFAKNLEHCGRSFPGMQWCYVGTDSDMAMIDSYCRSVRGAQERIATGDDGLAATAVALAAYESSRSGKVTKVESRGV